MNITRKKFKNDILEFINQSNGLRCSEFDEMAKHPPKECPDIFKSFSMRELLDEIIKDESVEVVEYSIPRENGIMYDEKLLLPKGTRIISIEDAIESYKDTFDNRDSYPEID